MLDSAEFVRSVFHPSDFSEASANAFAHALAVALRRQTRLTILHAGADERGWDAFPSVRATLERWELLEPNSPRSAVMEELQLRVTKITAWKDDPLAASLGYIKKHPTDLIVLSTAGRTGLPRWVRQSRAEGLARRSRTMTLFVPDSAHGFVSEDDGSVSLRRILVPVDAKPNPRLAMEYAARAGRLTGDAPTEIFLLHVSDEGGAPILSMPQEPACTWKALHRSGDVVEAILGAADGLDAGLIVMATEGHHGILDALRGSVTERVVRQAPCPVLAVPTGQPA